MWWSSSRQRMRATLEKSNHSIQWRGILVATPVKGLFLSFEAFRGRLLLLLDGRDRIFYLLSISGLKREVWIHHKRGFPKSGRQVMQISSFHRRNLLGFDLQDLFVLKTDLQNGHAPGGVPCRFLGRSIVLGFLCDEDSVLETSEFVICGAMFTTLNLTFSDKVWKCLEHIQEKRIARRNSNRISNCKLPCGLSLYGWQLTPSRSKGSCCNEWNTTIRHDKTIPFCDKVQSCHGGEGS